jgi:aspartate/methionine/tyrosine aminotransferase
MDEARFVKSAAAGAFNPLVRELAPPPIPAVQGWARAYDGAHGEIIDLSQAVPGYPPHPDLRGWLAEAARDPAVARYGQISGDPTLRSAYARHVSGLYRASLDADNVQITAGCNQAFAVAVMAMAGPGDAVLLTNPCYFNHETTLQMMGVKPCYLECAADNGFLPVVSDIADALDETGAKALALVSPNNPTGAVYPVSLLEEIFALCRARGVWLILDETYRDFLSGEGGVPHTLFQTAHWRDNLIQLYSFSKSFCIPGHRLGAIVGGVEMISQTIKIMDNLQICAPRIAQQAVAKGLEPLAEWREQNRQEIDRRTHAMHSAFEQLPAWRIEAIGAYFAFVRHPFEGQSSAAVAERLARTYGLITIPGSYFGRGLDPYLRVAFANADTAQIAEAAARLGRLMR